MAPNRPNIMVPRRHLILRLGEARLSAMLPLDTPEMRVATEPRIGGIVRTTEEEEELLLALTILRLNQRFSPHIVRGKP